MFYTVLILSTLILIAFQALAIYAAVLIRKHFRLLAPLWASTMFLVYWISIPVDEIIRNQWRSSLDIMSLKVEDFWKTTVSELVINASAIQGLFENAAYLLLLLILLSDMTKLLGQREIPKPKFLPDWSNRTIHIVGALALLCYLLSHWLLYLALLIAGAV